MKKISIILFIYVAAMVVTAVGQTPTYQGKNIDVQVVSVEGCYQTERAYITLRVKAKTDIREVSIDAGSNTSYPNYTHVIDAWDYEGNTYYAGGSYASYPVSQGIYVKVFLSDRGLYLPNYDTKLRTLRIPFEQEVVTLRDVPVHWSSAKWPMLNNDSVADGDSMVAIKPISLRTRNGYINKSSYKSTAYDSAFVVAAVGDKNTHSVAILSRVKLNDPGYDYSNHYMYVQGEIMGSDGLWVVSDSGTTKKYVAKSLWSPITTTYTIPDLRDTISSLYLYMRPNESANWSWIYARNVAIQWVDLPEVKPVTGEDLVKMIGKNCVGTIRLGMRMSDVPPSLEGMYDQVVVETTYSPSNTKGKMITFYSQGKEIMHGFSFDSRNRDTGCIQWLMIHVGDDYVEVNWKK